MEHDGKYLMLHRTKKEHDASQGKWIGVGGKCEANESPDECMTREVLEETGLSVTNWRYRGIVTFISDICPCEYMHLFSADRWTGEMRDCDEGELQWIDKNKVFDLSLWEGDRIFLRLLMDDEQPFFSLKLEYEGDTLKAARLDGKGISL